MAFAIWHNQKDASMKTEIKKIPVTVSVTPETKKRLGMAALLSGRGLSPEAEARLIQSLDADKITMPERRLVNV